MAEQPGIESAADGVGLAENTSYSREVSKLLNY